jgi:hypothetical protein
VVLRFDGSSFESGGGFVGYSLLARPVHWTKDGGFGRLGASEVDVELGSGCWGQNLKEAGLGGFDRWFGMVWAVLEGDGDLGELGSELDVELGSS